MAVDIQTLIGKTIRKVEVCGQTYTCSTRIPDAHAICTFDLRVGKQTWLVLDDYGNDWLPSDLEDHYQDTPYTVAIDKETGEICLMLIDPKEGAVLLPLIPGSDSPVRVPTAWRLRLNELKSCKRPFRLIFQEMALLDFISREIGYQMLMDALIIDLDFSPYRLQIGGRGYREISNWNVCMPMTDNEED